jgi:hypothetical protein
VQYQWIRLKQNTLDLANFLLWKTKLPTKEFE